MRTKEVKAAEEELAKVKQEAVEIAARTKLKKLQNEKARVDAEISTLKMRQQNGSLTLMNSSRLSLIHI